MESEIRAIRFEKSSNWTTRLGFKWCRANNFKIIKPFVETDEHIIYYLHDPHLYRRCVERDIGDGIFMIIGYR